MRAWAIRRIVQAVLLWGLSHVARKQPRKGTQ